MSTPRCFSFTTTMGMIDRIHCHTTDSGTNTSMSRLPSFSYLLVAVIGVTHDSDTCHTDQKYFSHFVFCSDAAASSVKLNSLLRRVNSAFGVSSSEVISMAGSLFKWCSVRHRRVRAIGAEGGGYASTRLALPFIALALRTAPKSHLKRILVFVGRNEIKGLGSKADGLTYQRSQVQVLYRPHPNS